MFAICVEAICICYNIICMTAPLKQNYIVRIILDCIDVFLQSWTKYLEQNREIQ